MISSVLSFLYMGNYGFYVWPCYILLMVLIIWHIASALKNKKQIKAKIFRSLQSELGND